MTKKAGFLNFFYLFIKYFRVQAVSPKWINCYYTNWSQYRPGEGKYLPEDIDASLCTHIYFSFAKMCQGNSLVKSKFLRKNIGKNGFSQK